MNTVTLSPKFQIVIPAQIRGLLTLHKGMRFQVIAHDERIELIPVQPMSKMRGFLKGMDTTLIREPDREI